jgi:hypothetical protein
METYIKVFCKLLCPKQNYFYFYRSKSKYLDGILTTQTYWVKLCEIRIEEKDLQVKNNKLDL